MSVQNTLTTKMKIGDMEELEVPLHFTMNEFVPSKLAQHMLVQGTHDHFVVSFFEANPPIVFNSSPELVEEIKQTGFTAECVARIAIPHSRFKEFARVFADVAGLRLNPESEEGNGNSE